MSSKARQCQACGREIEDTHGSLSGMHRESMGFIIKKKKEKEKLTRRWKKKQKQGLKERRQRKLVNENTREITEAVEKNNAEDGGKSKK